MGGSEVGLRWPRHRKHRADVVVVNGFRNEFRLLWVNHLLPLRGIISVKPFPPNLYVCACTYVCPTLPLPYPQAPHQQDMHTHTERRQWGRILSDSEAHLKN